MMKKAVLFMLICFSNGWLFANHWTPDDSMYEDNMTLTAVIQINGVEQQSTTLEVGAFCGEECRGSSLPTFFPPTQRYVIQLLVFGENGDQLSFKLYDHALGQELNLVSEEDLTFTANGYGSLSDPYVLNFVGGALPYYSISANANPAEGGTVGGAGSYEEGQTCTLVATANEGYAFTNWTEDGNVVSTNSTYAFTVTSNRALEANFISSGNHWIPNESGYEDNMTLTGVIQINGIEQQSTTLEVGVFCGDECRSTGMPTYFFPTQRYIVNLLVYGEYGDQLTFKLYDHALGQELDLTSPDAIAFISNGYGTLGDPYVLNFESGEITQTIPLSAGWNWISTYIDLNEVDGIAMLEEALGDYGVTIQTYNESADYFGDGEWSGLEDYEWTNAEMVMVEVSEDCTIDLAGPTVAPSTVEIEIYPGWNWIGFPLSTETAIGIAMAGFEPEEEDAIQSNVEGTSDYLGEWIGDVLTLVPGQGYMYYSNSTEPKTLVFSTTAGGKSVFLRKRKE